MSKKLSRIAQEFLAELWSSPLLESLNNFVERLEEKEDPDPFELKLLESLYGFSEKIGILENILFTYVKKQRETLPGNKLQDLYDNTSFD